MPVVQEQSGLHAYYTHAIERRIDDDEGLLCPPAARFSQLLAQPSQRAQRTALDLGYGFGNHTMALASAGFSVDAVDVIPPHCLHDRLTTEAPDAVERVAIHQADLRTFVPSSRYDFVLAKDVLHFLEKPTVARLLGAAVACSEEGGCHFITMFTDISRTARNGDPVSIDGEAGLSKAQWIDMAEAVYDGWLLTWEWADRVQRERLTGRVYFHAAQATLVAVKP